MTACESPSERPGIARSIAGLLVAILAAILAAGAHARAERLSPLAPPPDWSRLDGYHETIAADDLRRLLDSVYAPAGAWREHFLVSDTDLRVRVGPAPDAFHAVRLAPRPGAVKPPRRYWRPAEIMAPAPPGRPMAGVRVALDPGHLGGQDARVEERWFQVGNAPPVTEGDLTLRVARILAPKLEALGAEVVLVRDSPGPLTRLRPEDLMDAARASLADLGVRPRGTTHRGPDDPRRGGTVQYEAERLYYRVAEIRERARRINGEIRPDVAVCIHFNAEAWGDPHRPRLTDRSHVHCIVNGCYGPMELTYADERFGLLLKLLGGTHEEELALNRSAAQALARVTGLPPYVYHGRHVRKLDTHVWARNLLANRLYECPVLYLEPYVMNSEIDHARIKAGDYEGTRVVAGRPRPSIFREYADGVARGMARHYAERRPTR